MEMRHSERRIQVRGGLIVLHGAGLVAGMLPAERHQVVGACIQFIEGQNMRADALCFRKIAPVGKENRYE